jgi:RimJ/RimL family protein N-acetyltransferase
VRVIEAGPRSAPSTNDAIGDFVSTEIWGEPGRITNYCSIGILDGDRLVAGVLYHNHYPDAGVIELTAASTTKRWLTRPVLKAMFSLPFDRFGCQLVVLRVAAENVPMRRMAKAYGFNEYVIPRLRGRGLAEIILTLTDDDWRRSRFHKEH